MKKELTPIKCQICNKECKGKYGLTYHLSKTHHYNRQQIINYYDIYFLEESNICICGEKKKFGTLDTGYAKTCGKQECINIISKQSTEQTCLEKYGIPHTSKLESVKKKSKETHIKKYGKIFNNREQAKETNLKKYGVEHYTQTEQYKIDIKQTSQEKYGCNHHLQSPEIIKKRENSNIEKYGVKNVFQSDQIKEIIKESLLENYGVNHPMKSSNIKQKAGNTFENNNGRKLGQFTTEQRKKGNLKKLSKKYDELFNLNKYNTKITPLFSLKEYQGVYKEYKWKCKQCNEEFYDTLNNEKVPRCPICNPKLYGMSKGEKELFDFLSYYVYCEENKKWRYGDRNERWHELDIFIPSLNIGIEYNGVYYHSENSGECSIYKHKNKTDFFNSLGISIFQITDIEWENYQDIIKSILLSKIQKKKNIIYARKCIIKEISNKDYKNFTNNNHIHGYSGASIKYGLYYKEELVSIISFSKSRFDKKYDYELIRFCNLLNNTIIGGFSKLLKYFKQHYIGSIISYADRRFSNGAIYEQNGFELIKITEPNYWYFTLKKFDMLYNRIVFQKHKLKNILTNFDPQLTEWENMKLNGWDRIWDCGNLVYIIK